MKNPFTREQGPKAEKTAGGQLLELVVIVAIALGLALGIQAYLVKPYKIPSESMVPTLEIGQRVLVNRIGNTFNDPEVGDVVVFNPPAPGDQEHTGVAGRGPGGQCGVDHEPGSPCPKEWSVKSDTAFIKRVVGGPGDTIAIDGGRVVRNGKLQDEPFIRKCASHGCDYPKPITVPAGHWFMMGDNRGASDDSRFWGPVPKKWIIGVAFATYWPPNRVGLL